MDDKMYSRLIEIFRVELSEQIQVVTDCLLDLEKSPEDPGNPERINTIFRAVHNIKGAAKGVGADNVGEIAHRLEDLFSEFRQKKTIPDAKVCGVCFKALDGMNSAMEAVIKKAEPDIDIQELLNELKQVVGGKGVELEKTDIEVDEPEQESSVKKEEVEPVVEKKEKKVEPVVEKNIENPVGSDKAAVTDFMRVSVEKLSEVSTISDELIGVKIKNEDLTMQMKQLHRRIKSMSKVWQKAINALQLHNSAEVTDEVEEACVSVVDQVVELSGSVGEMQTNMRSVNTEFGLIVNNLQENVRVLRLMPVGAMLRPLLRNVRDLEQQLHKKVKVELIGEGIEIDRAILDHIKSPLIHLIRNSLDHGIESTEERARKNKSEVGKLIIKVEEEGGQILISITDDGGGIDVNKILEVAVEKNLIIKEEAGKLSKQEILDLITTPGFSTNEIITEISGRGVGLDIVRTNIQEVKGSLEIETEENQGTTITMRLPLTLITDRGIVVRMGDRNFIVPTIAVNRILHLSSEKVHAIEGGQAIMLEEQPIPLYSAAEILNINVGSKQTPSDQGVALVMHNGRSKVAFIVDEIIGEREIAIKPLSEPLTKTKYLAGATLSGRGDVILILYPSDLIETALQMSTGKLTMKEEKIEKFIPNILVVDDSITTRVLEVDILKNKGYRVSSAANGAEAWEVLQKNKFDLVVTDVEMPVMNGFELTQKIKNEEKFEGLPVVIVTALEKDEDKRRGIEVGADAYVVKSHFETNELLEIIDQLV